MLWPSHFDSIDIKILFSFELILTDFCRFEHIIIKIFRLVVDSVPLSSHGRVQITLDLFFKKLNNIYWLKINKFW